MQEVKWPKAPIAPQLARFLHIQTLGTFYILTTSNKAKGA